MPQLSEKLLTLPLFQGMSQDDLSQIVGQTKFGFHQFAERKVVLAEGTPCEGFMFLLNGTLSVESIADDHGYRLVEELSKPTVLQPEHLFGLHQRYTRSFTAKTACHFLTLDKNEVIRLADEFIIFRLNMLNIISTVSQKQSRRPWHVAPQTLPQRIARFIEERCLQPTGEKELYIKMPRLADELNDSRLDISRALNTMQADGLLQLSRGKIHISALELLLKS